MAYQVNWDNGANACGTFPDVFPTEAQAEAFGENWVAEMRSADPDATEDDGYSFEVIEIEDTPEIDPEWMPDNPSPPWF